MAHPAQWQYCDNVRQLFPKQFSNARVLDVGSLDINGSNKPLFTNCIYTGLDIAPGSNVDVVSKGHEYRADEESFDTIISTECFEHDKYIALTLQNIVRMLRPEGLFTFTCATTGRAEHGTRRTDTYSSPLTTSSEEEDWGDYYKNLTEEDFKQMLDFDSIFSSYEFNVEGTDIRFWGIKRSRVIDCIMLTYTKNEYIRNMTQNAINSLHLSSPHYKFNVWLMETNPDPVSYHSANVIQPGIPFNYNQYLNLAFKHCKSDRIIIANNDIIFHQYWYENIVKINADSASPVNPGYYLHTFLYNNSDILSWGFSPGKHVCGWCLVVKKSVIDLLSPFDESFEFYCQDCEYAMQLKLHGFNHALVGNSCVAHLTSLSYDLIEPDSVVRFTDGGRARFFEKYPEERNNPTI
jgi:SAM-dependent methyltransferase